MLIRLLQLLAQIIRITDKRRIIITIKNKLNDQDFNQIFPSDSYDSPLEILVKGAKIQTIIQCGGLWFANGKFGMTWKLVQSIAPQASKSESGCLFKQMSTPLSLPEDSRSDSVAVTLVEDSDDEGELKDVIPQPSEEFGVAPLSQPEEIVDGATKKKRVLKRKE
jgi:hypothetical protein